MGKCNDVVRKLSVSVIARLIGRMKLINFIKQVLYLPILCFAPTLWALSFYEGRVVSVHDGDTVQVVDVSGRKHKVRLANIDAPELDQAYGKDSRDALRNQVLDERVQVKVYTVDRYKREVGMLILGNQDVNLFQVALGNAWHYTSIARSQQDKQDFSRYRQAENEAKQERLGLWRHRNPVAPWKYRREQAKRDDKPWWSNWF